MKTELQSLDAEENALMESAEMDEWQAVDKAELETTKALLETSAKETRKQQRMEKKQISFKYPDNRDSFSVKQIGLFLLMGCLLLFAYHQTELIGRIFFVLFACAVGIELLSNAKTFFIDEIIIDEIFLILKKKKKVHLQEEWSNVAFKVTQNINYFSEKIILDFYGIKSKNHILRITNRDLSEDLFTEFIEKLSTISGRNQDDFIQTSNNQLLAFNFEKTDDITTLGECNKLTYDAVFAKYGILILIGMLIAIIGILIIIK
ncbi:MULTISPECIES: hypothetical protein [unclassified Sulfurospirillum]|uniref:hypothetical protein n=1 Tax=unclassified Sulfurospirillum TaxID=2618290 RepID=UPI000506F621|nr:MULTISPECIES: hypothetical protein [unclassified Sulfurospirillum]KFL33175.1 hypothetical protein JU57_12345 [Sulfurospirillum sp. SCADC]